DGRVDQTAGDFSEFQKLHRTAWGPISSTLRGMEGLLANAANAAAASTPSLSSVAQELELGLQRRRVTERDLLFAAENPDSLLPLLGRGFRSPGGHDRAATRIQASWRAFLARRHFERHRRRRWAAGVVAVAWMLRVQRGRVRRSLAQRRQAQLENFRTRAQYLAENWKRIQSSRRTIIHIPSLGYSKHLRRRLKHFDVLQNLQMGRLCDIKDPNVDVIYVSPVPLSDEVLHYYERLLGLSASGGDGTGRYTIIVPDAVVRFPNTSACVLPVLMPNPPASMGKTSYWRDSGKKEYLELGLLCPRAIRIEDLLSLSLSLVILPLLKWMVSLRSKGGSRVQVNAVVSCFNSVLDSHLYRQLVESLSRLVAAHAGVRCWLLKTEEGPGGRGTASCPVAQHLPCHRWVLSESRRYGSEQWRHRWAQIFALSHISQKPHGTLSANSPINPIRLFPCGQFIHVFITFGIISQREHQQQQQQSLTLQMVHYDSIIIRQYISMSIDPALSSPWGNSGRGYKRQNGCWPQIRRIRLRTNIRRKNTNQSILIIRQEQAPPVGSPLTLTQSLELNLLGFHYSIPAINSKWTLHLMHDMTQIAVPFPDINLGKRLKNRVPRPHTTPAALTHDLQERQGTVFTLIHGQRRERLGMMVIMDDLQVALMTFAQNLALIHQQISSADMQGETNFKEAVQEIESILGITVQNRDREEKERESGGQLADHTKATTTVT
uniref:IQCH-like ATP-grasp domain-containing protein n=1 Tax=Petromyzon marinus TaxID=7757 RepID=S4R6W0_PETMA